MSMIELIRLLNDKNKKVLILVQSNRDDDLRLFSAQLVRNIFNDRRVYH